MYDWLPTPSLIYPELIARVPTSPRASRVDDVPDAAKLVLHILMDMFLHYLLS